MGIYLDKSTEHGIRYRDVFLCCDVCEIEGYGTTRAWDSRRLAKKDGWLRRWSNKQGKYIDIRTKCQDKYIE